jgi:predicted RND superfamily exporter protein
MTDKIINLDAARRRNRRDPEELAELLGRMDELEELLETMDELGVTSRDELVDLLERLEKESGDDAE